MSRYLAFMGDVLFVISFGRKALLARVQYDSDKHLIKTVLPKK